MATQLTIPEIISIGNSSLPFSLIDLYNGSLFNKSIATQKSCVEIAMFTDILSWQYEQLPNDTTLRGTANYLIWLCGKFGMMAKGVSGGGSVTPLPPVYETPDPLEFVVNDTTSPIISGGSTLVIPEFIGYNLIFTRNNIPQSAINTGNSWFSWSKLSGTFTCYGAAVDQELFQLNPIS